jgi:lipopolysaccharide/colanic/teichoic acid biosynthesis glycosyltransferase
MGRYETSRVTDEAVAEAVGIPYVTRPAPPARPGRPVLAEASVEIAWTGGRVHAAAGRPARRDRCLVLVEPELFEQACRALGTDEGGPEVTFPVSDEPVAFRALLGSSLLDIVETYRVRRVLIAPSGRGAEEHMLEVTVDRALETAAVSMPRPGLTRGAELAKRGFDLVVAATALLLAAPLLALISLLVRLGSPGPTLFRQTRVGRGGLHFEMLKFRTMVEDAEARKGQLLEHNEREGLFKMREDPRVTRIGRWLRQTNLDEVPQLINVLRGEMSLVGPRPLVPEEDAHILGWRRRRLDVPPGMTGCWQVGTPRVSLDEMIVIDHLYSANWSLWRDVKCIVGTVPSMVLRRGQ